MCCCYSSAISPHEIRWLFSLVQIPSLYHLSSLEVMHVSDNRKKCKKILFLSPIT